MTTALKFIHLAAIAIWSGGLLALPFLFWQRRGLQAGPELDRLHRIVRLVYVVLTSPAAFVAIASGTGLIFLQATFEEWFSVKMVLVGGMAMVHQLFSPKGSFSGFAFVTLATTYAVLITAILWVVLAKPQLDSNAFAAHLFEPGALSRIWYQSFGETRIPMP